MDSVFVQGLAGFIAAILVFCGSVWLLLALVLGARLAYFVAASVTLSFVLILGVVWSVGTPLGPVGELPSWNSVAVGDTADEVDFGPISAYPDGGGWRPANPEDQAETSQIAELEGEATELLAEAMRREEIQSFSRQEEAVINSENSRLLEQDGTQYGAVTFEPAPAPTPTGAQTGDEPEEDPVDPNAQAIVVMEYDPGNPLGKARLITAGTALLFAGHMIGLARAERSAKRGANGNGNGERRR